jgi:tyrosine-protein phosphatase SIW14
MRGIEHPHALSRLRVEPGDLRVKSADSGGGAGPRRGKPEGGQTTRRAVVSGLGILLVTLALLASSHPIGAAAQVARPPEAPPAGRLDGLAGLRNVGRVAPGIYRGAQPEPGGYATLKAMGVRTVINLRARHGERAAVETAGMRSIEIPFSITDRVDTDTARRVVDLMADPARQPLFVHCAQGRDRTGVVVAVYRMEQDGWTPAAAEAEMEAYGFHDIWVHLREFVRHYRVEHHQGDGPGRGNPTPH